MVRQVNAIIGNDSTVVASDSASFIAGLLAFQYDWYNSTSRRSLGDWTMQIGNGSTVPHVLDQGWQGQGAVVVPRFSIFNLLPDSQGTIVDQGGAYCLSLYYWRSAAPLSANTQNTIIVRTGTDPASTTDKTLSLYLSDTGVLTLADGGGTALDTFTTAVDTEYHIEVYFGDTASDSWEWWINGTSQGSGTTGDFSNAPNALEIGHQGDGAYDFSVAHVVFQSGCTSTADRLGVDHYTTTTRAQLKATSYFGSDAYGTAPTTGGDTPSSGLAANLATALEGPTIFTAPLTTAKSAWMNWDGVIGVDNTTGRLTRNFGFPLEPTFSDPGSVWTGEGYVWWSSITSSEWAYTTTQGSSASNYVGYPYMFFKGNEANSCVQDIHRRYSILAVVVRIYVNMADVAGSIGWEVRTSGWSESLGSGTITPGIAGNFTQLTGLATPTGGWSWGVAETLQIRLWKADAVAAEVRVRSITTHVVAQENFPDQVDATEDPKWIQLRAFVGG